MKYTIDTKVLAEGNDIDLRWGAMKNPGYVLFSNQDHLVAIARDPENNHLNKIFYDVHHFDSAQGKAVKLKKGNALLRVKEILPYRPGSEEYSLYDSML